jgi:Ca-activated chloride channel homolog
MNDSSRVGVTAPAYPVSRDSRRHTVPMLGMNARGRLDGLMFELEVEQRYRNDSARNLEVVFTFPVPLRAVLLGLELEIGGRRLEAVAMERVQATEKYERAIDDGDAAVLLESRGNGLWTVSVGNLKSQEEVVVRFRHAELLDANRGYLRLTVPTVIAPRYGERKPSTMDDDVGYPDADALVEYPFDIRVELVGLRDAAGVGSPTHKISAAPDEAGVVVTLARGATMDRDFVIEVEQARVPATALVAEDPRGAGWVAIASVVLETEQAESRPLALKLLIDCSGSMGGDSIDAARRAVLRTLDQLDPRDHLSVQRFGSSVVAVTPGMVGCDAERRAQLRRSLAEMSADLGGTEMGAAMRAALNVSVPKDAGAVRDLLVITDGEIEEIDDVVSLAASSGHRLFVVAVGAAPVEALARRLAEETGGACEFVAAGELAEEAVLRMVRRLRAAPRVIDAARWPVTPVWTTALPNALFAGETVHLVAGFAERPTGTVECAVRRRDGQLRTVRVALGERVQERDLVARVAAMRRVGEVQAADERRATELAVQYQLATRLTSYVVVAERTAEEKAQGLPATVKAPQMLAAGWGGSGSVMASLSLDAFSAPALGVKFDAIRKSAARAPGIQQSRSSWASELERAEIPDAPAPRAPAPRRKKRQKQAPAVSSSRRQGPPADALLHVTPERESFEGDAAAKDVAMPVSPERAAQWLEALAKRKSVETLVDLQAAGVDPTLVQALRDVVASSGESERRVVDAFVQALIEMVGEDAACVAGVRTVWQPQRSLFASRRLRGLRAQVRGLVGG